MDQLSNTFQSQYGTIKRAIERIKKGEIEYFNPSMVRLRV